MAAGLQDHRAERERPHVVAAAGRAEREARVVGVLLGPVEGRVQPGAERGVLQGVAGELPVGAVQDEGEEEQQAGGDVAGAGAGGRAARRDQRGEQRGGGDLVRGQAAAGAPAGEVAGVRADAVGGEEAVAGLDRGAQPDRLVVDGGDGLAGLVARLRVGRDGGDQGAELGAVHGDAVGVEGRGERGRRGSRSVTARPPRRGALAGPGPGSAPGAPRAARTPRRGRARGGEAGVGERQAQGVPVCRRSGVDDGDPLAGRDRGEQPARSHAASAASRTSKPSDRRSPSSGDPGTGWPVRMAVDRRTHSLECRRGLAPGTCVVGRRPGLRGGPGGTSAEAIG